MPQRYLLHQFELQRLRQLLCWVHRICAEDQFVKIGVAVLKRHHVALFPAVHRLAQAVSEDPHDILVLQLDQPASTGIQKQ